MFLSSPAAATRFAQRHELEHRQAVQPAGPSLFFACPPKWRRRPPRSRWQAVPAIRHLSPRRPPLAVDRQAWPRTRVDLLQARLGPIGKVQRHGQRHVVWPRPQHEVRGPLRRCVRLCGTSRVGSIPAVRMAAINSRSAISESPVAASERQHRLHPSVAEADSRQNSGRNRRWVRQQARTK